MIIERYIDDIEGITFSGGEPLYQAKELLKIVKKYPELDKMLFTGYYYHELNPIQKELYNMFDLVVEGRYEYQKRGNLLWRGSSNQIFSSPTQKYSSILETLYAKKSAGLEVVVKRDEILFYGISTDQNEIEKIVKQIGENRAVHINT